MIGLFCIRIGKLFVFLDFIYAVLVTAVSASEANNRLIENRVFSVVFVFNFVSGLFLALRYFLPFYLMDKMGFSGEAYSIFIIFFNGFYYVVNPILFLIVLYFVCGGRLFERIASTLISLILGCLLGQWLGGLVGVPLFASQFTTDWPNTLVSTVSQLPYVVLGEVLFGFAVLAFFDYNKRWSAALSADRSSVERPLGVVVLSVLYVIGGIVDACLLPLLFSYSLLLSLFSSEFLLFVGLLTFILFSGACQLIIAWGLYSGRKWGWLPAFVSSIVGLLSTLTGLLIIAVSGVPVFDMFVELTVFGLFMGFIISLVIMFYLLDFGVRRFFGMINPSSPSQAS